MSFFKGFTFFLILAQVSICAFFVSCQTLRQPAIKSAELSLPADWQSRLKSEKTQVGWVSLFKSKPLKETVFQSLKSNKDYQAAAQRLLSSKFQTRAGLKQFNPEVIGGLSSNSGTVLNDGPQNTFNQFGLNLSTSWEVDIWRRVRNQKDSLRLDYLTQDALLHGVKLSLAANTARSWVNLVTAQQQLQLSKDTLDNFEKSLRVIEGNYKAGVPNVTALDVQFGRNNVTQAKRSVSQDQLNFVDARQTLQLFLYEYPSGTNAGSLLLPNAIESLPRVLPAGVLEQRPDLIASRFQLQRTAKDVLVSKKNLLPTINLGGALSDSAVSLTRLLNPQFLTATLTTSLTQPLFDSGRREDLIKAALAQNKAALYDYQQVVLEALREVEFAITAHHSLKEQLTLVKKEVKLATLAESQAQRDYSEGIQGASILRVLEAQRRAVNARGSLIIIKNRQLLNQIDFFLAIGGKP